MASVHVVNFHHGSFHDAVLSPRLSIRAESVARIQLSIPADLFGLRQGKH